MNALIPLHNPDPAALFAPGGLDAIIDRIRHEARALVGDLGTAAGRDAIASNAAKVARAKTYLDGLGKDYVSVLKELPKKVDAERRRMRDALDALKDEVRAPLTAWEQERLERERHRGEVIRWIASQGNDTAHASLDELADRLAALDCAVLDEELGDRLAEAQALREERIETLRAIIAGRQAIEQQRQAAEQQAAEQARQAQVAREIRIAKEAAEQATRATEEKALPRIMAAERDANIAAHALELALSRAHEAPAAAPTAPTAPTGLDREIRAAVHREIVADLCDLGLAELAAQQLVRAIATGRIAHLSITY